MIQASELRVGNWVFIPKANYYDEDQTGYKKVVNIDSEGINADNSRGVFLKDIEPIPLTPEILEKCGFDYIDSFTCMKDIWVFKRSFGGTGLIFHYEQYNSPKSRQVTIVYLHQLQNLYFALTGEELTVNL